MAHSGNSGSYERVRAVCLDITERESERVLSEAASAAPQYRAATFPDRVIRLEGAARLLWGAVPLIAGGTTLPSWPRLRGLISDGVDPESTGFFGWPEDKDQRFVEMAAIGYALAVIPQELWEPLQTGRQQQLSRWLSEINRHTLPANNWLFFRMLVNCGLYRVGAAEFDAPALESAFDTVERFYLGDGWYNDGDPAERRARDYYVSWAFHVYGLLLAACLGDRYPEVARRYVERAAAFSRDFQHWFAPNGAALPYGRSLSYTFAQAALWGALAYAGVEALPWGRIKGLYMQSFRYWRSQASTVGSGKAVPGYGYPNGAVAERYISANSPLFALKSFLPLALSRDAPFWAAEEEPSHWPDPAHDADGAVSAAGGAAVRRQEAPGFLICSSPTAKHHYALCAGQWTPGSSGAHGHMAEKYAKFAYSSAFGFNVASDMCGIEKLAADSMLLVGEGDGYFRPRTESVEHSVSERCLSSVWHPYPDVRIETWLAAIGDGAWHLRAHRIESSRPLAAVEGGFPLPGGEAPSGSVPGGRAGQALVVSSYGVSLITDLGCGRHGAAVTADPNSNILHPRVSVPTLQGPLPVGSSWLFCLVYASCVPKTQAPQDTSIPAFAAAAYGLPANVRQELRRRWTLW